MAKKSATTESVHAMSVPELQARLREVQESHFRLQFRHATNPLKNPLQIRQARREVARLKTVLHQKKKEPLMDAKAAVPPTDLRNARQSREGVVVSDKMNKTRVVLVSWSTTHPRYHKVLRRTGRLYAHDEKNDAHAGDRVEIMETRPLSKLKRWRITRILEKSV